VSLHHISNEVFITISVILANSWHETNLLTNYNTVWPFCEFLEFNMLNTADRNIKADSYDNTW